MNLNWAFFAFILVAFAKGDDTTCDTEFEYFPDPYDCQSYYECIDGIKERSTCPDSFLWDATKNICSTTSDCSQLATSTQEDETTSAGASTDETPTVESTTELVSTDVTSTDWSSTDETTTEWASTDATSTDETTTEPSTCEVNSVEGDSSNCTLYYYCDGNKWITFDCPSDLYWSQALQGCVDFKDSDCDCLEGQFTGDVEDCSKYFSCEVFNWTGPLQCPDDLYWSEELQTCVEFGDSDCKKICINGYFAADDEDCSRYYYCENYNWTGPIECPENLYWSESHQTCVNFGESDCEKICISGYFSGDKEDCSRYYYCQDYNWTGPLNCPQDLYWSNTLNGCVDFGDSDCEKPCQSGNFTGDSQDCQVYYACENYNWTGPIKCPDDLYWSQSFEACVILEESDCSADTTTDIPGTSEEPTSTPEESTSEQPFTDETTTTISQSTEEPTTEQPTSEVSPPDETTTEQPTSEVSPSDESTTEQPTSEVSPSDESTTEQPTSEVSPPDETTTEQVTSEAPTPYETTTEELSTDATTISEPTEETTSSQISTEEPATDSTPTESTTVNPDLPCEVDGEYFPDHYDCHGFYQCIDGVQQHDVCADELLWDVNTEGCSETSDCSQLYTTTSGLNIPTALRIKAIGKGMK